MLARLPLVATGLVSLANHVLADVDCNSSITIANATDAEQVRKACTVIRGDVTLTEQLLDTINLDGVEEIHGDLTHYGCDATAIIRCKNFPRGPLEFSSSTLRKVNGSIDFMTYNNLEKLSLPNLSYVWNEFAVQDTASLKEMDLTNLESVSSFELGTTNLEKLHMDGIKELLPESGYTGGIYLNNAGKLDNVDAFFKNPINTSEIPTWTPGKGLLLNPPALRNVRTLNLGWTAMDKLEVWGTNLTIVLGGPETKSISYKEVILHGGVLGIQRADNLESLHVDMFRLDTDHDITDLTLPFDTVDSITLFNSSKLRSLTLPSQAENWKNLSLSISGCGSLRLESENGADGKKTWYWPKSSMASVNITSNVSTSFFDSFIANNVEVTQSFSLSDASGKLDCGIFANRTLPSGYTCDKSSGAPLLVSFWTAIVVSVAVMYMLV
uniref:Receptor L-domain domain-containing protein n=1 Tax=Bionectria ochroleuca TaxID=29856 RepID=A0A8H7TVP5_BIOOC